MDLVVLALALLTVVGLIAFAGLFALQPDKGLQVTKHEASALPLVMAGRYGFMALAGLIATIAGGWVFVALFAGLGLLGLIDAFIYARRGGQPSGHLIAGIAGLAIAALGAVSGGLMG